MTLNEWIIFGSPGASSITMWAAITGAASSNPLSNKFVVPADIADFERCYKFVKQCDITEVQLLQVKKVFPFWEPFIDSWKELCRMYECGKLKDLRLSISLLNEMSLLERGYTLVAPKLYKKL